MLRFMINQRHRKAWKLQKEIRLKLAKRRFFEAEEVRMAKLRHLKEAAKRLHKVCYHMFKLRDLENKHEKRI